MGPMTEANAATPDTRVHHSLQDEPCGQDQRYTPLDGLTEFAEHLPHRLNNLRARLISVSSKVMPPPASPPVGGCLNQAKGPETAPPKLVRMRNAHDHIDEELNSLDALIAHFEESL